MTKAKPFDAVQYLIDDGTRAFYLAEAFEDGNPAVIRIALSNVAKAICTKEIASSAGIPRK
jgi:probable addiction module antidote protein